MTFSTPAFPDKDGCEGLEGNGSNRFILDTGGVGVPSWFFPTDCATVRSFPVPSKPQDDAIRRVDEIPSSSICGITVPQASWPVVASGVPWPILAMR